jgi:glycosyltransferase involved in cell wall biosynthesis
VTHRLRRILMTVDAVGGVWRYAVDLSGALAAAGIETVLAVLGPPASEGQRAEVAALPGVTLVDTGEPLDWLTDDAVAVRHAATTIAALATRHRVDLIHANQPALAAGLTGDLPVVAVAHGCVSTWWEAARPGTLLDPGFGWHRALVAEGLRRAARVVAPSESYARTVARHYGLTVPPLAVHNGRTPAPVQAAPMRPIAFTAGRLWDEVKRTPLLDAAAGRLAVPLYAAGATRAPHGASVPVEHLHLLGELTPDGIAAMLAARPVFVSAASFEPFGLAVLEAAQAGCPLILSDIDTFRELWDGAARFVAGDDPAAWADTIAEVMGDNAERTRLADAALARGAHFTVNATATAMRGIYADAAAAASTGYAAGTRERVAA